MKLISATVRNYRIHRDVTVNFDPSRTLVGGANETGKSTLIEAVHRGLFLKANVTGEAQKSMVSTLHAGHPEVEIRFVAQGAEFLLKKRFSGTTGTTHLTKSGGGTWQGEEAETRLHELLGVPEVSGGRNILERVGVQWAHLWVWQGMSGRDPAGSTDGQRTELLQRLQAFGGGVAMQSESDARVAAHFAEAKERIFVRAGSARTGSDLARAQTEAEEARVEHAAASDRLARLEQTVREFEEAVATARRAAGDLEKLSEQRTQVDEKLAQAEELSRSEERQSQEVKDAADKQEALESVEQTILGLRDSVGQLQASLAPKRDKEQCLAQSLDSSRERGAEAEGKYDEAQTNTRVARLRKELAGSWVGWFEKQAREAELRKRLERVQAFEEEIAGYQAELSRLAAIDQKAFTDLQHLESKQAQAQAALNAMAAEIELVAAPNPVRVGSVELSVGKRQRIVEPTEVSVGDTLSLKIYPGGGDSLTKARNEVREAQARLQRSLDEYGLQTVAAAAEALAKRTEVERKRTAAEAAVSALDADDLADECSEAETDFASAEADVARRMEQLGCSDRPDSLAEAKARLRCEDKSLRNCETLESEMKVARDALLAEQSGLTGQLKTLQGDIAKDTQKLTGFEAQLRMLLDSHGEDAVRAQRLAGARLAKECAEEALTQIQAALSALQPDQLSQSCDRLQRAITAKDQERQDAERRRAVSQAALRSDGAEDPHTAQAQAVAKRASAEDHLAAVSRKAQAIALIDELFQHEQQALADRFSQPLAEKIGDYLKRLFGPEARAVVTFEDNAFKRIELVRSAQGGAMPFDTLSGGTREQVAAAVRLAIAELLAADHDGSLPVVFDDAFAYSDPDRVNTMQGMLDLGASRGLQVIVLSCNPSDYAGLGARSVTLSV
ncbi:MAG: chromosome segregation protein [Verrucomicrobia bacterium ADurb.Bin070]|nr:MAG: chromosome segregation protein [Verrucomicrobia bacterium ADurb.Bin070]